VGEHADDLLVAAIPDGECAAGVLLEARQVEPISPRRVLKRVVADRRPEAGNGFPLHVLAGSAATRYLALAERVAPVLDAEGTAGGRDGDSPCDRQGRRDGGGGNEGQATR